MEYGFEPAKLVDFSGEDIDLVVNVDNQGWSTSGENIEVHTFKGRRPHAPKPLVLDETVVLLEANFGLRVTMDSPRPVFDWGLGCFGNPSKLVETGKEELVGLFWKDFHEIRTAKELFDGHRVFKDGDDDWIHFVRVYQRTSEDKAEEELIAFHQAEQASQSEPESDQTSLRPHTAEAENFLAELVAMESAPLQGETEEHAPNPIEQETGDRTWKLRNFRDWIEEVDFIEANATMPSGTRYYTPQIFKDS
ncbi:hypothetical protein F5Y05DRAFT_423387 [Hypoxylon sp. FL0543]|nr:hypothetical protein F5Y05DRAFT_423387 [Hypoxylon sp. FL0543]